MYFLEQQISSHFQKTPNRFESKFMNAFCDKIVRVSLIPSQENENSRNQWK